MKKAFLQRAEDEMNRDTCTWGQYLQPDTPILQSAFYCRQVFADLNGPLQAVKQIDSF